MVGKVELCGLSTSRLTTLSGEETKALLLRSHNGDSGAREKLIEGNLRLVLSVVQRFASRCGQRNESMDDLFQVGCIGLMKAIDHFDITQNVRFSTYGVPMIVGEIRRYLRDNSAVRVSRSMRDLAYKVLQMREQLTNEKHTEPTVEELSEALQVPRCEIVTAMEAISEPMSLYEQVGGGTGDAMLVMDQVADTRNTDEEWIERLALNAAVEKLDPREKHILALRFYAGKTQMEVSDEIGISQAQVSRLEKNAILQIKKGLQS